MFPCSRSTSSSVSVVWVSASWPEHRTLVHRRGQGVRRLEDHRGAVDRGEAGVAGGKTMQHGAGAGCPRPFSAMRTPALMRCCSTTGMSCSRSWKVSRSNQDQIALSERIFLRPHTAGDPLQPVDHEPPAGGVTPFLHLVGCRCMPPPCRQQTTISWRRSRVVSPWPKCSARAL